MNPAETGFYYLNSRYYDPEIGRFINADDVSYLGADGTPISYNLYAYCMNNPVNYSDPTGHWIIKDAIKWIAHNIARPVIKKAQTVLSKVDATYSVGLNLSGSPSIFCFNLQGGVSVDTKGNVALQGSLAGGFTGGTPSASVTMYQTVTNAPSINHLEGPGYQVGGSVAAMVMFVPLAAGVDINIIPDATRNKTYYGATANLGFGLPDAEVHVEWGQTGTWKATQFNVFDVAKKIYRAIMEW